MIKVNYTELDGPYGPAMRLEAAGHAGYAPAGQDIVCAGVSTLMQALVSLLAGEENAHSDAFDEPDGPRLTVTAARPCTAWVEGAFELAKAGFALLAERYPDNVRFADRSARGKQEMMDLQLFADGGEAAAPALSAAQEQQAVASGTMKPGEKTTTKEISFDITVESSTSTGQIGESLNWSFSAQSGKLAISGTFPKGAKLIAAVYTAAGRLVGTRILTAEDETTLPDGVAIKLFLLNGMANAPLCQSETVKNP